MSVAELQAALSSPGANNALTRATLTTVPTGTGGTVRIAMAQPAVLAAQAGLSREEYALARCITSEGYGGDKVGRAAAAVAIGQAIRNGARLDGGKSIEAKLTASTFPEASGFFGEQAGRYAATTQDPTWWAGQVAQAVLNDDVPDLARGGHKFLDMAVFARGEQAGRQLNSIESTLRAWMLTEGNVWLGPIPTVDTYHLVVLGRGTVSQAERQSQLDDLLAIYEDGKAGNNAPADGDPDADVSNWQALVVVAAVVGAAYLAHSVGWL